MKRTVIGPFFAAWRFLTIFPAPPCAGGREAEYLRRSLPLFPLVGLLLGTLAWLFSLAAVRLVPVPAAAMLVVAALAVFSGGLHLDGLADSCDGLFSHRGRGRALDIMRDSRIGTMGAIGITLALLAKFACLSSLPRDALPAAALVVPLGGRVGMSIVMAALPYARESGMGNMIAVDSPTRRIAIGCAWLAAVLGTAWGPGGIVVGFAAWAPTILAWTLFLRKRLGGATGDTFGAASELGEVAISLAASLLWDGGRQF